MQIRRLTPEDASAFLSFRFAALLDMPSAFGSSYEEERVLPLGTIEGRLAVKEDRGIFGALEGGKLIGMVALGRESMRKLAHKGMIWGMYVAPESRGQGVGKALLLEALALARSIDQLQQVNLSVNAANLPAIRLYESVGFKEFGHEPGALLIEGELHDEVHMYLRLHGA